MEDALDHDEEPYDPPYPIVCFDLKPAARYETSPPGPPRAIAERIEFHHSLGHGERLNLAEIEISVVERGCLAQPMGDVEILPCWVSALETERSTARCTIH
jgi:hypothetical protein